MSREITPFQRLRSAYRKRMIAAALLTAFAFGGGHASFAGAPGEDHTLLIVLSFAAGLVAFILLIELTQRWHQLRQIRIIEDDSSPYGFTGTVPPGRAANDLGRKNGH